MHAFGELFLNKIKNVENDEHFIKRYDFVFARGSNIFEEIYTETRELSCV